VEHHAVGKNALFTVNIGQECIERVHALGDPAFDERPFVGRSDARYEIEGQETLSAAGVSVLGERYAALKQDGIDCRDAMLEIAPVDRSQGAGQSDVMGARHADAIGEFVVKVDARVALE
jgi:hypothetical protein